MPWTQWSIKKKVQGIKIMWEVSEISYLLFAFASSQFRIMICIQIRVYAINLFYISDNVSEEGEIFIYDIVK